MGWLKTPDFRMTSDNPPGPLGDHLGTMGVHANPWGAMSIQAHLLVLVGLFKHCFGLFCFVVGNRW